MLASSVGFANLLSQSRLAVGAGKTNVDRNLGFRDLIGIGGTLVVVGVVGLPVGGESGAVVKELVSLETGGDVCPPSGGVFPPQLTETITHIAASPAAHRDDAMLSLRGTSFPSFVSPT